MLLLTAKLSKKKLIAAVLIVAVIVSVIIVAAGAQDEEYLDAMSSGVKLTNIRTNEDRVAFLAALGWQVEPEPCDMQEAVIPKEFTQTYQTYNSMQKLQGFDLEEFAGKKVKRFTYKVLNYPGISEDIYADILVYKKQVIGGDICCRSANGFMHGLTTEAGAPAPLSEENNGT